jgi:hypothetical protein
VFSHYELVRFFKICHKYQAYNRLQVFKIYLLNCNNFGSFYQHCSKLHTFLEYILHSTVYVYVCVYIRVYIVYICIYFIYIYISELWPRFLKTDVQN